MIERPICPHCGYDIQLDQPIMINDFSMNSPVHTLFYKSEPVHLTPAQRDICWALMKNYPAHVTESMFIERLDSEAEDWSGLIKVHISRIRKKLRAIGAPPVIKTLHYQHAYIWDPMA